MGSDDFLTYALIAAVALGAVAVIVALVALVLTRQTNRMLRALGPGATPADPQLSPRRAFGNLLRRYSEILGVEVVTGRVPNRGDTSVGVRVKLEHALSKVREPGAVELLDEVSFARDELLELEPAIRAAENGLIAMRVEWSIERWVTNPRAWLADTREQDRLERLAHRAQPQPRPQPEPVPVAAAS